MYFSLGPFLLIGITYLVEALTWCFSGVVRSAKSIMLFYLEIDRLNWAKEFTQPQNWRGFSKQGTEPESCFPSFTRCECSKCVIGLFSRMCVKMSIINFAQKMIFGHRKITCNVLLRYKWHQVGLFLCTPSACDCMWLRHKSLPVI